MIGLSPRLPPPAPYGCLKSNRSKGWRWWLGLHAQGRNGYLATFYELASGHLKHIIGFCGVSGKKADGQQRDTEQGFS